MSGRQSIDERLLQLRQAGDESDPARVRELVSKGLADRSNLIVAQAARLVIELELREFIPDLIAAWERLSKADDPIKADKGCTAKSVLIEALGQFDHDDPDLYLAAIAYRQREPMWPKDEDTAESVRGGAAFALARSRRISIVSKLTAFVDLLYAGNQSRSDAINAARAIADTGSEVAIPVLRQMLLSGHGDAEAQGACMSGLLSLAADESIPLVARYLKHPVEEIALEAAAALGICGRPKAVEAIIRHLNSVSDRELRRSLLISIGLARDPLAVNFLISHLESNEDSQATLQALQPACIYPETQTTVRSALKKIGNKKLLDAFEKKFGRG
jgi:HEAT repeat protein